MGSSKVLSLSITVFVCAMMMTSSFAEAANETCQLFFVDLQKPDGNCEKPVLPKPLEKYPNSKNVIVEPGVSPDPPLHCPKRISVSWLHNPPYVHKTNKEDTQPSGIFVDLLHSSLSACCRLQGVDPPNVTYDARPAKNLKDLHMKMYWRKTDFVLPVTSKLGYLYERIGHVPFDILLSPGDALLINTSLRYEQDQSEAWQSLLKIVPILLLSILLAAIAGICIWGLDTKWNPKDFPRPFTQGASEGFWWAFVTMTTVGYGDRTPKSFPARIFGIFWIVVSLAICSIMTASITASLTSINVAKDFDIFDKDLAVLKDSESIKSAVAKDANPKVFKDFDSMYNALNKGHVDGILMEIYAAYYAIQEKADENLNLVKTYTNEYKLGFVMTNSRTFQWNVQNCLKRIFAYRENDVIMTVNRFSQDAKRKSRLKKSQQHSNVSLVNFDSPGLIIIIGIFVFLFVCGAVDQVYRTRRRKNECGIKEVKNVDSESLEIKNHATVLKS